MVLWSVLYKSYRQISTHTQRETNRQTDRQTERRLLVIIPPGLEIFSLSLCGPITFLGLTLRRDYLGYLLQHFNISHLKP